MMPLDHRSKSLRNKGTLECEERSNAWQTKTMWLPGMKNLDPNRIVVEADWQKRMVKGELMEKHQISMVCMSSIISFSQPPH